jgi:hypothetical protein
MLQTLISQTPCICNFLYIFSNFFWGKSITYILTWYKSELMLKVTVFWDIAPCSFVELDRSFRDAYCFHHQGNTDYGCRKHLWNFCQFLPDYMAQDPRRQSSSYLFSWEPEICVKYWKLADISATTSPCHQGVWWYEQRWTLKRRRVFAIWQDWWPENILLIQFALEGLYGTLIIFAQHLNLTQFLSVVSEIMITFEQIDATSVLYICFFYQAQNDMKILFITNVSTWN